MFAARYLSSVSVGNVVYVKDSLCTNHLRVSLSGAQFLGLKVPSSVCSTLILGLHPPLFQNVIVLWTTLKELQKRLVSLITLFGGDFYY